ncbi:MAG: hypothetical protein JWM89_3557 [Acidimicrobiales bacterium]|nr:hypothetical protein [Acidimicrobiales bacterium]
MPNSHLIRRLVAASATATLLLAVAGCAGGSGGSGGSDDQADTKHPASRTTSPATATSGSSSSDAASETTQAAEDEPVLGTATGQRRAGPNKRAMVPLRLDVRSVKRLDGDTIEVRFTITNTSEDGPTFEPFKSLGEPVSPKYDVAGVALIDRPHDKKYLTLVGSDDVCLCSGDLNALDVAPGESASMYADVTAPPASVDKVDLTVPGFDPIVGLEIR